MLRVCRMTALSSASLPSGIVRSVDESVKSARSRGLGHRFILTRPDGPAIAGLTLFAGGHSKLGLGPLRYAAQLGGN